MAKLVLILFCCFVWVGADPFFFNIQKSYVSQSSPSTSRPAASQSISLGTGGIFSKWLLVSQIFANKFTTQRPRATQRPVVQIDPVYKPVDLDKENESTPSTEVPAEEIGTTKKTTTTSSYEYTKPSTTQRTTTEFSFSESTTEAETFKPTTYRPITTPTTRRSTTTSTTTTEKSEEEIGYEIDSSERDKPNEIIEPSTTSRTTTTTTTTTEEYVDDVETTQAPISLPLTYLPPLMKDRRVSTASVGLAASGSISSGVLSANTNTGFRFSGAGEREETVDSTSAGLSSTSGNARPFDIVSFRGSIADDIAGEGVIEEARSAELADNGINPRVFYFY